MPDVRPYNHFMARVKRYETLTELEKLERRREAMRLMEVGLPDASIAPLVGVSKVTMGDWRRMRERGGSELVLAEARRGPKRVLTSQQAETLLTALKLPPSRFGIESPDDKWTWSRVPLLAKQVLGIEVSRMTVRRVLQRAGFDL
jgi:transposase